MSNIKLISIKCNTRILNHEKDSIVTVKAINGEPVDIFWRRRISDAAKDKCCEIVKEKAQPKTDK